MGFVIGNVLILPSPAHTFSVYLLWLRFFVLESSINIIYFNKTGRLVKQRMKTLGN